MKKVAKFFLFLIIIMIFMPMTASADFGPKPSIKVIVSLPSQYL